MVLLIIGGLSTLGKVMQKGQRSGQPKRKRTQWPGPVAGPGLPGQEAPWPWPGESRPAQEPRPRQAPQSPWPSAPEPTGSLGRGAMEGTDSIEGIQSEGVRSEGDSGMVSGSLAEERARFLSELEQFRRARPETTLHHPRREGEEARAVAESSVAALLTSREGLAQAMLLTEVLGKPRALRPWGRR